jgi:hypothetical protein
MQTLSRALSPLSQLLAKRLRFKFRRKTSIAVTDAFGAAPDTAGWHVNLRGNRYLIVQPKTTRCFATGLALYLIAGLLANEWLYLLSIALAMCPLLGIALPWLTISSLEGESWIPDHRATGDGAQISVRIWQKPFLGFLKLLLPVSCLRVRVVLARRTIAGYQAEESVAQQSVCLDNLGHEAAISLKIPALGRGIYRLSHLDVATCMPFGFAWAIGRVALADAQDAEPLVVMPHSTDLRGNFLGSLQGIYSPVGVRFANVRAFTQSSSVRGLRDFRQGDSIRHIHWASSARLCKLLVREFDSESLPVFNLFLDLAAKWQNRQQFELAVQLAYSLVQFGFDKDMLPELILTPSLDSEQLQFLMSDLPQMKPPLDWLGDILARVEPLPYSSAGSSTPVNSRYQVLAITPSQEVMLVAGGKSSPVTVMVVNPDTPPSSGQVIAIIHGEKELQAL